MEIIGVILKYIFLGFAKFFRLIWMKWSLAGVLAVLLVIELAILFPVYESSVNSRTNYIYDVDILNVEQSDNPGVDGRIFVTYLNKSNTPLSHPPYAKLMLGEDTVSLSAEEYYEGLNNEGFHLYRGNAIPPGTVAKVPYRWDSYISPSEISSTDAKIIIDDYSIEESEEFEFEYIKGNAIIFE